jgi:hypothetical protein
MRKHFLIATFSAISASAPHRDNPRRKFLTATDQTEKFANHMKRNEKRFSNRNTEKPSWDRQSCLSSSVLDWGVANSVKPNQMRTGKIARLYT